MKEAMLDLEEGSARSQVALSLYCLCLCFHLVFGYELIPWSTMLMLSPTMSNGCNATVLRCIQYHDKVGEKVSLCGRSWSFPRLFMSLLFLLQREVPFVVEPFSLSKEAQCCRTVCKSRKKKELYHCRSLVLRSAYHHSPRFAIFCSFSRSPACCLLTCPAREK